MAPPRNSEFLELDEEDGEDEDAPALVRAARPIAPTRARDLVDEAAAAAEGRGEPTLQRARRVTATTRQRALVDDDDAREGERLPERASVRPGAPARESSRALEFDDDEADAEEQAPTRRPLGPQRVAQRDLSQELAAEDGEDEPGAGEEDEAVGDDASEAADGDAFARGRRAPRSAKARTKAARGPRHLVKRAPPGLRRR